MNTLSAFPRLVPDERPYDPLYPASLGWPMFPVHSVSDDGRCSCRKGTACTDAGKHPRVTGWPTEATADRAQLERWRAKWPGCNWGIATGPAGLVVVDIDPRHGGHETAYELQQAYGTFPTTPLVDTGGAGGEHLYYARPSGMTVRSGQGTLGAGIDVKAEGGFVVAPGSRHASQRLYRWRGGLSPADVPLATLPPWMAVLLCAPDVTEKQKETEKQRTSSPLCFSGTGLIGVEPALEEAIRSTMPERAGQRNRRLFDFARRLKALPQYANLSPAQLNDVVRRWHVAALPVIGTKPFDDTRADFLHAWSCVRHPHGTFSLDAALTRSDAQKPPAVALRYDAPDTRRLVALCRELQRTAGAAPFFLSSHEVHRVGLCECHVTAWRRLRLLVTDRVLELVDAGTPGRGGRAARFRYLGPQDGKDHP